MTKVILLIIGLVVLLVMIRLFLFGKQDQATLQTSKREDTPEVREIKDIRTHLGYPPKMEIFIEQVSKIDHPEWDYHILLYEASEQYLGSEQFDSLEKRFSLVRGIEGVMHEDKESFLVRSKSLSADEIRSEFWKEIQEAARIAFHAAQIEHCPSCGKKLKEIDIVDTNSVGYKCDGGHYLHVVRKPVHTADTIGKHLKLISGRETPEDVFREWLSNPLLRNHLNDSLANVLRFILEKRGGKQLVGGHYQERFCLSCGNELQQIKTDDLFVASLRCVNGHLFWSRNGIWSASAGPRVGALEFDYDERMFRVNLQNWLDNRHFQGYVPDELRDPLRAISLSSGGDAQK